MDATTVDWSMGSSAARLADWDVALQFGRKVAGPGIRASPVLSGPGCARTSPSWSRMPKI